MDKRRVRIEFFWISGIADFSGFIESVWKTPRHSRIQRLHGTFYNLYDFRTDGDIILGEIGRMSTDMVDPKGDRSGNIGPMPLEEDEGQVTPNFFAYHIPSECMALPFQHSGFRAVRFREYLNTFITTGDVVALDQVPRPESITKLMARIKTTKKLSFKFNVGANTEALRAAGLEDNEIIQVAKKFHAATIKVEISAGRINAGGLKGVVSFFRGLANNREAVPSGQLIGVDEDGAQEVVQLLEMMLKTEADIEIDPDKRHLSRISAYHRLKEAIHDNQDTLRQH